YTGVLMVQRLPIEQVHKVCAPTQLACAMVVSTVPDPNGDQASGKSILTVIAPLVSLLCRPTTTSENIPRKNPKKNFATKPGNVMDGPQTILAAKADGYG